MRRTESKEWKHLLFIYCLLLCKGTAHQCSNDSGSTIKDVQSHIRNVVLISIDGCLLVAFAMLNSLFGMRSLFRVKSRGGAHPQACDDVARGVVDLG